MRKITLITALALALAVFAPTSAAPAAGGSDLPFNGVQSGFATTNLVTGQAHLLTSGNVNHFGLATSEQDLQLVPTGPATFTLFGTWTLMAARRGNLGPRRTGHAEVGEVGTDDRARRAARV